MLKVTTRKEMVETHIFPKDHSSYYLVMAEPQE